MLAQNVVKEKAKRPCMGVNFAYDPIPDRKDTISLIHVVYEMGETFFDTAEVYGPHTNEELVGATGI